MLLGVQQKHDPVAPYYYHHTEACMIIGYVMIYDWKLNLTNPEIFILSVTERDSREHYDFITGKMKTHRTTKKYTTGTWKYDNDTLTLFPKTSSNTIADWLTREVKFFIGKTSINKIQQGTESGFDNFPNTLQPIIRLYKPQL